MDKLMNARSCRIFGIGSFLAFSLSMLIGHEEEAADHIFLFAKAGLILISACLFLVSCHKDSSPRIKSGYAFLSLAVLIYQLMLIASAGRQVLYIRDYPAILSLIVWTVSSLIAVVRFGGTITAFLSDALKDRGTRTLIIASTLLSAIVIILSAEPNGVRFSWDSDTLYEFIYGRGYESLFDAKQLTFHSHVSIVYAYMLVLFKLFFGDIRTGYFVLNALCIIAAAFGMMFLMRRLAPGKRNISYILSAAMFMLSPWVCGMSTYHMYDYYIWCLIPLLFFYASKKNWIGFFAVGVMITFSKTTGLAVFGSACLGVLSVDAWSYLKAHEGFGRTVKNLFTDIKYWCFLCVLIVFTLFFKLGISEDTQFEDTTIGFDAAHTLHQMKLFTFSNFIWIFVAASAVLLIMVITKKISLDNGQQETLLALLVCDAVFFIFNCLCITYRMPRYMDSHIAVVYIGAAFLFLEMKNEKAAHALTVIITAVTFIGGFRMIDPLSLA
ncbi:MAG: hypothetical protein K6G58_09470, partial [Lachnospiraceae bacterium]|nr:hypothetical protein [Lachnospiraceae bacterium]